jgi:hypothetical protein
VIPVLVTAVYYWLEGALDELVDGAFVFPVTHLQRQDESVVHRLDRVRMTIADWYPGTGFLIYGGVVALLVIICLRIGGSRGGLSALVRTDPLIHVILSSFLLLAAVSTVDFQGYPDLYPLLPYAALGIGGAFRLVLGRFEHGRLPVEWLAAAGAVLALVVASWLSYSNFTAEAFTADKLPVQRRYSEKMEQFLDEGERPFVLGDTTSLILTGLRTSNQYSFLASGVDGWVVDHTPGGVDGWQAEILAADPPLVVLDGPWRGEIARDMRRWLRDEYRRIRRGELILYLPPATYERALRRGVVRGQSD